MLIAKQCTGPGSQNIAAPVNICPVGQWNHEAITKWFCHNRCRIGSPRMPSNMFDSGIDACLMPGAFECGRIQGVFVKPNESFSEPGMVHGPHPDGSDEE